MADRIKGDFKFAANFEVAASKALDPRMVVDKLDDLINYATWPNEGENSTTAYIYDGMVVSVKEDNSLYMLTDSINYTNRNSWKKLDIKPSSNIIKNSNFEVLADGTIAGSQSTSGPDTHMNWWYAGEVGGITGSGGTVSQVIRNSYLNYNAAKIRQLSFGQSLNLITNRRYTLSFIYKTEKHQDTNNGCYINHLSGINMAQVVKTDNIGDFKVDSATQRKLGHMLNHSENWSKASITFTAGHHTVTDTTPYLLRTPCFICAAEYGVTLYMACVKLEEGDTATEYDRYEDTWQNIRDYKFNEMSNEFDNKISEVTSSINTLVGGNVKDTIESFNEVISFLDGISDEIKLKDTLDGKQDKLESGTNIKTINGESLLGAGDLPIKLNPNMLMDTGFYTNLWSPSNKPHTIETSLDGSRSIIVTTNNYIEQDCQIIPNKSYTLSFKAKNPDSSIVLEIWDKYTGSYSGLKVLKKSNSITTASNNKCVVNTASSEYKDYFITFTLNCGEPELYSTFTFKGSNIYISKIKLEEGEFVTPYVEYIDDRQVKLESGTNIKTINGESLLGDGNIQLQTELPTATAENLGVIKVGENLSISEDGTLSVEGNYAEISSILNSTLPKPADDNASLYGYIGTLKNIGLSSENDIEIKSIKFQIRDNRDPQAHPEVYIRLLKKTDRDWTIIAQSNSSKTIGSRGEYMTFDDLYNVSGEKLRDTDLIAITFVQHKDDDRLVCTMVDVRTTKVSGGIRNSLSYDTTSGESYSPAFELGYIELQNVNVSAENISFDNSKIQLNSSTVQNAITELRGYVGDNAQNIQKITYQELLDLKTKDSLVPGKKYRIINYDTTVDPGHSSKITVVQNEYKGDTESNRFDVIVEAINSHDLSENAQVSHCHTSLYNDANSTIYANIKNVNRSKWNSSSWITNENDVVRRVPDVLKNKHKGQSIRVGILTKTIEPNTNFRIQAKPHTETQSHDKILHIIGMDFVDQTTGEIYSADYGEIEVFSDTPVTFAHLLQPNISQTTTVVYRVFVLDDPEIEETAGDAQISLETYVPYFRYNELYSWKIKYCLHNDTSRFAWADPVNGKGVIYYMKDENGNEAPYDFKNILFNGYYTFHSDSLDEDMSLRGNMCSNNSIKELIDENGVMQLPGNLLISVNDNDVFNGNIFNSGVQNCKLTTSSSAFNFKVTNYEFLNGLTNKTYTVNSSLNTNAPYYDKKYVSLLSGGTPGGAAGYGVTSLLDSLRTINSSLGKKQATLESGTNIKTINGESLLGKGDISWISKNIIVNSNFDKGSNIEDNTPWSYKSDGSGSSYIITDNSSLTGKENINAIDFKVSTISQNVKVKPGKTYTLSFGYAGDYGYFDYGHKLDNVATIISSTNMSGNSTGYQLNATSLAYKKATAVIKINESNSEFIELPISFTNTGSYSYGSAPSFIVSEIQLEEGEASTNYKRREDGLASIKDLDEKQDILNIGSGLDWSIDSTKGTTLELNIGSGLTCNSDKALIVNIGSGLAWNADGNIYVTGVELNSNDVQSIIGSAVDATLGSIAAEFEDKITIGAGLDYSYVYPKGGLQVILGSGLKFDANDAICVSDPVVKKSPSYTDDWNNIELSGNKYEKIEATYHDYHGFRLLLTPSNLRKYVKKGEYTECNLLVKPKRTYRNPNLYLGTIDFAIDTNVIKDYINDLWDDWVNNGDPYSGMDPSERLSYSNTYRSSDIDCILGTGLNECLQTLHIGSDYAGDIDNFNQGRFVYSLNGSSHSDKRWNNIGFMVNLKSYGESLVLGSANPSNDPNILIAGDLKACFNYNLGDLIGVHYIDVKPIQMHS